jgi:hypothetical protein
MISLTNALKMAAVTLTVAAGCASAQELKADIPFTFKAGGAVLPAGSYRISDQNGMRYIRLRNEDTRKSVLLIPIAGSNPSKAWKSEGTPKLGFVCGDGRCSLNQLWDGTGSTRDFSTPGFGKDTNTHISFIDLRRDSVE